MRRASQHRAGGWDILLRPRYARTTGSRRDPGLHGAVTRHTAGRSKERRDNANGNEKQDDGINDRP